MGRDMQKRRANTTDRRQRNIKYRNGRKLEAGFCAWCFELCNEENVFYFHWDHIDPELKRADVSEMHLYSILEIQKEIDKCQLLCFDCHMKRTQQEGHQSNRRGQYSAPANTDQLSFDL